MGRDDQLQAWAHHELELAAYDQEQQMKIASVFPSDYLRAGDLQGRTVKVKIAKVTVEKMGDDTKPVAYFAGKAKGLVLNKTNAQMVASAYGDETDAWIGKEIELRPDKTQFNGQLVDCLRVQIPETRANEDEAIPF